LIESFQPAWQQRRNDIVQPCLDAWMRLHLPLAQPQHRADSGKPARCISHPAQFGLECLEFSDIHKFLQLILCSSITRRSNSSRVIR
jgi:hypothetical protein